MKRGHSSYTAKNTAERPLQNLAVKRAVKSFYWPYYFLKNFYSHQDGAKSKEEQFVFESERAYF
jgi:hypothetical protein